jgi:CheY-like chemotaxis protein
MARTAASKGKSTERAAARPTAGADVSTTPGTGEPTGPGDVQIPDARLSAPALARVEQALRAAAAGDFSVRLPARRKDAIGGLEAAYNELAARTAALEAELVRVGQIIGREGGMTERARLRGAEGAWGRTVDSVNGLIDDLTVVVVGRDHTKTAALLRAVTVDGALRERRMIAYLQDRLSNAVCARIDALSKTAVMAVVDTPERLVDRAAVFLHRVEAQLPTPTRRMIGALRTGNAPLQGRKVLVIDDDIRNVFALTSTLEQRGMKVVFAENGREGIDRLLQHANTDLILLDIMMPEMDGYETARAIRSMSRFEHLPIISLTAKAMKGDREKAIVAGASDYITKPVDVDQLVSMMRVWLDV